LAEVAPATRRDWVGRHEPWLTPSERARLLRIVRPQRRAQFVAGHVLLRRLVAACAGLEARAVAVESLPDGRPWLGAPAAWQVSLAHSQRWVAALAGAGEAALGVDIEWINPARAIEALVQLAGMPRPDSREHAYLLWAQREAQFKAAGGGAGLHVAIWQGHALAVCGPSAPAVAWVDLADTAPAQPLALTWAVPARWPAAVAAGA
jgi:4'-phosphopantetheinyl transferase